MTEPSQPSDPRPDPETRRMQAAVIAAIDESDALTRMIRLGDAGITVSIHYGSAGMRSRCAWTVHCRHEASGREFDQPFGARSFIHCIEIAEKEATHRAWLPFHLSSADR